jgi:hypothetical protein
LAADERMPLGRDALQKLAGDASRFTGRAEAQVDTFLQDVVKPRLAGYKDLLEASKQEASRVKV